MSQNERLLEHLKTHGSINPVQALEQLGIYRLASRACELRQDGHNITSQLVIVQNRFGESCKVAEYRIVK